MSKWRIAASLFLAASLSAATLSFAQMGGMMRPPQLSGVWNPIVGSGAAYEMSDQSGKKNQLEITIVGKETVNGKDGYWLEMGFEGGRSDGMMYMKTLVVPDQGNMVTQRVIMQIPGQPNPMEMTSMMKARGAQPPQASDFRNKAQRVGAETITVPAGTFACEHWQTTDDHSDVWFTNKVAPWGLVKMTGKSNMVLMKTISDAKDHITGTPVPMGQMGRPPA